MRAEKSKAFFDRQAAKRRQPGNCARCGRTNPDRQHKTCPRCLKAVRLRKIEHPQQPWVPKKGEIEALQKRLESIETAVANLQISHERIYQRAYNSGRKSTRQAIKACARELHRLEALRYADAFPAISGQELATFNHAYDRQ